MKSFSETILEGLIHNLRSPLNLVLGYAQKLDPQTCPDYKNRIYNAGIMLDDQLQNTWEALQYRSCEDKSTDLNEWLKQEIVLLNNYMQIKHRMVFETIFADKSVSCNVQPIDLCNWFETLALALISQLSVGLISIQIAVVKSLGLRCSISLSEDSISLHSLTVPESRVVTQQVSKDAQNILTIDAKLI